MSGFIPLARLESPPVSRTARGRVAVISLGCAKNLVDAEQMLGALGASGYEPTPVAGEAEVVIVNTCGFLASAREEATREIREAARLKREGRCEVLVVSGCLAQIQPERIRERCPQVDAVVGVSEFHRIAEIVESARSRSLERPVAVSLPEVPYQEYLPRRRATPPWTAYLKISEGCDCACTFCTIPAIRGRFRSRPLEGVVAEAERLGAEGVREIVLIAEDLTGYGQDWSGRRELARLLRRLGESGSAPWIRLLYCYPTKIDEELIETMAAVPAVVPYLDVPFQHGSDRILKAMGRAGRRSGYLRLLERLREAMPEVCLRSTMIVGFPGERRPEFEALRSFLEEARLDRVGFFPYSREPGTAAAELPGQVAPGVARSRVARLAEVQAGIALERNRAQVGRRLEVLVEKVVPGGGWGRSYRDAPEIDGVVEFEGEARPGELVPVTVTAASTHDLQGRVARAEEVA